MYKILGRDKMNQQIRITTKGHWGSSLRLNYSSGNTSFLINNLIATFQGQTPKAMVLLNFFELN